MKKKFIYICSPCRGDYEKNIEKAKNYCREIMTKWPDVVPIAPHIYFTQFFDDTIPNERSLGLDAGLALLDICDELWAFGLKEPSEGMKAEIEYAEAHGIPVRSGSAVINSAELAGGVLPWEEVGDALLWLPSQSDNYGDVEIIKNTAVRISGPTVLDMAKNLKRHRGHDIDVCPEVEQ